ncbi:MAG: prepilin-type N-terminal cleavage/methylation domain-containing protein [Planctomycetaceae bacterium]|nr:prepilin-type N-terminal cleavage/methylation domain-containing protein [Planctomycetaceae bacterium]
MTSSPRRRPEGSSGFTLIELLVVICIIGILVALTTVGIVKAMESARTSTTQTMLDSITGALAQYAQRWGDYPPTTIDDLGARAPNDLNNGIESLVACLSSSNRGGILFKSEDHLTNVDGDSASKNVTNWYFGDNQLREWVDEFGNVLIYMHHKDFARPKASMKQYRFAKDGEEYAVTPEQNPATKTFSNPDKFQLRSVGRDGKPGTQDDIRASY